MIGLNYLSYAMPGPPTDQTVVRLIGCKSASCNRIACCASERDYAEYCCRRCAETKGVEHASGCDANWARERPRVLNHLSVGDLVDVELPELIDGRVPETRFGIVTEANPPDYTVDFTKAGPGSSAPLFAPQSFKHGPHVVTVNIAPDGGTIVLKGRVAKQWAFADSANAVHPNLQPTTEKSAKT